MKTYTILTILCTPFTLYSEPVKALICVPVADLVGQPMRQFYGTSSNIKSLYKSMPECGYGTPATSCNSCPRLHQALLHEPVEIIEHNGPEVRIKVHNVFYISADGATHTHTFWTHESNIIPINKIKGPVPSADTKQVILLQPTYIKPLHITLSAGTRCAVTHESSDSSTMNISIFNQRTKHFEPVTIPRTHCLEYKPRTMLEKRTLFLSILRSWAHQTSGAIPYTLGGCSFTRTMPEFAFELHPVHGAKGKIEYAYTYPANKEKIKTGLDCSGLISRAAQICGIPYHFKNSITAAQKLPALQPNESIETGDLLWLPGHIMVISHITHNLLIEARGYQHGYGKVHEIPLSEQFEGINTYDDLIKAYRTKKPLRRLDKFSTCVQIIRDYKILKLNGVLS